MAEASLFYRDPTITEMRQALAKDMPELDDFDREAAIWWFAADYHGGQWSNLYAALSASQYRPGACEGSCPEEAQLAYNALVAGFVPISARAWKDYELGYCYNLVAMHGDENVGHDPKTIATYLRLQASSAFRDGEYEIAARLGAAATAINEDARNNHVPAWERAVDCLTEIAA